MSAATVQLEVSRVVRIPISVTGSLEGNLDVPRGATGLVVFAHGSGSSRFSPRNQFVAESFRSTGLGTLLFDLLTREEEAVDARTTELRFNIPLLTDRLVRVARWLEAQPDTDHLRIGYFGSSTGGGAALVAAAQAPDSIHAVVSRGGRPDLAGAALKRVQAPTLLIVGENDLPVIELNQTAQQQMTEADVALEIVPAASHLFEEPGALEQVADLAQKWFSRHLATGP